MTRLIRCDLTDDEACQCAAVIDDGRNPAVDLHATARVRGWRHRVVDQYEVRWFCPDHADHGRCAG